MDRARGVTRGRASTGLSIVSGIALAMTSYALMPARAVAADQPADTEALCAPAQPGYFGCFALRRTDVAAVPSLASPNIVPMGYGPADLASAYRLPGLAAGGDRTVAVVDAYDAPNAEADLATYRAQYGLPPCTTANGCFRKVDQNGGISYPVYNAGWAGEIALDLDMVSATCPACHILLVEATTASTSNLGTAVNRAVTMGADAVSNSYGGVESTSTSSYDSLYFNHPGVAITASTGDCGYNCTGSYPNMYEGVQYPAASRYVVAVGGTSLARNSSARGWTESVWGDALYQDGAGSGCSLYSVKPTWQTDPSCAGRMQADVSAVADPSTGVAVYNSGDGGWTMYGGTSASSPIIASIFAMATAPAAGTYPAQYPYADTADLYDVSGGSNDVWGDCTVTYYCTGVAGYDGPTGLGTPNGVAAFGPATIAPGKPTAVTAELAASGAVRVLWAAPTSGDPASGYVVNASSGGRTCVVSGSLSCVVSGLTNGSSYTFTVTAQNAAGPGPVSDPSNAVTPEPVPGAPTGVHATPGDGNALVSWSAANDNGSAITRYDVASIPAGAACMTTGALSCTVDSLVNGNSYAFTVTAANGWGPGPASDPSNSVIPSTWTVTLGASATSVAAGVSVTLTAQASEDVSVTSRYLVILDAANSVIGSCSQGITCTANVSRSAGGSVTYHAVVGTSSGGSPIASSSSVTVTWGAPTVPGKSTSVSATAGNASATVLWAAPASNGGSPILGYTATASPGGRQCSTTAALSCTVTNLTNGQPYTFTVTARNAVGTGPSSAPSGPVTPTSPLPGLDQTNPPISLATWSANDYAQTFTTAATGHLSGVDLFIDAGKSQLVRVYIRTVDPYSETPTGANLDSASATVPAQSGAWVHFAFPGAATVQAGSRYAIVFDLGGNSNVHAAWGSPYTGGQGFVATDSSDSSWSSFDETYGTWDFAFKTYVAIPTPATYHAITPVRALDTRTGNGLSGKLYASTPRTFVVAGRLGVPANASAVTGNVTVVNAGNGWAVYLGPDPVASPATSTINFKAGQVTGNGLTVALSLTGTLSATYISTAGSSTDLVFDVTGYFTPDGTGATYHPMNPARLLDTRSGVGLSGRLSAGVPRTFTVAGRMGVPANATAVTGNVTVVNPTNAWAVYLGPVAQSSPSTSTINFNSGEVKGNSLTVALGTGGTLSATYISTAGNYTDLVFDVTGYYTPDATGARFVPISPARLLDTRSGNGLSGKLAANTPRTFLVAGRGGIPATAVGVTGNVTVVNQTNAWAIFVGPTAQSYPTTSTLNFGYGEVKGNGLTVALASQGTLSVTYISSTGNTTDLVLDVTGYYTRT